MSRFRALSLVVGLALIISISAVIGRTADASHVLTVNLGTAAPFAILAGTPNITDVPTSSITGNVGLSPATGAGIGLTCAQVAGTIYSVDAAGPLPCRVTDPGLLGLAKGALTTAFNDAKGRLGGLPVAANDLAGKTLTHGVYTSATVMGLLGGGTVTLDGGGDPNAVFIFQLGGVGGAGGLLTVSNGSTVALTNQAQSCNVFWAVDSATIGTTATFRGTILAATAITVANGSTIDGRLLAGTANVTLINDTITKPTCVVAPVVVEPREAPVSSTATPAPATSTPAAATSTPAAATTTPAPTTVPTTAPVAPTATPRPVAIVAPTASPATPVALLPNTSTLDRSGPPVFAGLLLALIGALALRSRRSAPTIR